MRRYWRCARRRHRAGRTGPGLAGLRHRRLGGEPALAAAVAGEIAAGNLRAEVAVADGDQASLMAGLKRMRDSLAGIVGQVRQGTALEETASSIEQLTQGIQHSADNAEQANELAAQASRVAQQGGAMVGQLVDTMGAINESSARIADIIGVIDGIAFQTNILALNAAKEIKVLIDDSTGRVADGSALAGKAGQTMQDVVASIDRVSTIMNDIVASSREQASGIARMDGTTLQNAALVEESAAATLAMRAQSGKLSALVAMFQVGAARARKGAAAGKPQASAVAEDREEF